MSAIVPIRQAEINGAEVNSVNARELWEALESKREFATWIKSRIEKFGFVDGDDFLTNLSKTQNGRPSIEYIITIDMAKELAMVENNEKGRQARRYFIEVEKRAKQNIYQLPQNFSEALRLAADLEEKNQKLKNKITQKDEIIVTVAELNIKAGEVSFADFAKNLAIKGLGRNNIIDFCKARGYLRENREPYQPYVNRGYFVRKPSKEKINGEIRYTTYLTPRGTVWLAKIIKAEFEIEEKSA